MSDLLNNTLTPEENIVNVACAVVRRGDTYLCMQRCRSEHEYMSEHWEFPGGKREDGESDHEALIREIREEMDWDIYVGRKLGSITYEYPDITIVLTAYLCMCENDDFKLLEHLDYKWLTRSEMEELEWTDADRQIIRLLD